MGQRLARVDRRDDLCARDFEARVCGAVEWQQEQCRAANNRRPQAKTHAPRSKGDAKHAAACEDANELGNFGAPPAPELEDNEAAVPMMRSHPLSLKNNACRSICQASHHWADSTGITAMCQHLHLHTRKVGRRERRPRNTRGHGRAMQGGYHNWQHHSALMAVSEDNVDQRHRCC